jgi:hypothetical protein
LRLAAGLRIPPIMKLLALALALALTGCATLAPQITEEQLNPAPRPLLTRTPDQVEVLSSGAPARPHVDFAVFHAVGGNFANLDELRAMAAKQGCDALVLDGGHATCVVYTGSGG